MIALPKAPFLYATTQVVANGSKAIIPPCALKLDKLVMPMKQSLNTSYSISKTMVKCAPTASTGITGPLQIRTVHTDIAKVPSFSEYRRTGTKNKDGKSDNAVVSGEVFKYMVLGGGVATGLIAGKSTVNGILGTLSMSADVLAMAKIEVNISEIPEGKNAVYKWRGKPLFVRHRTQEEIETERNVNLAELRDPQHDNDRVLKPEWLVVLGVCTHLGCVPIGCAGEYGGYFCPCHGSHYDASGRIRKGPAPLNLEVPEHTFTDEDLLIVG